MLAGVAGWPIAHSLSPALHGFWIDRLRLDAAYVPLPIEPGNFEKAVACLPLVGFKGINVTLPHKEAAFRLASHADDAARATGAANTLVFVGARVHAMNTDVPGFLASLHDASVGSLSGVSVLVLGAGGAARAIVVGLLDEGAPEVRITNRTLERAQALAADFGERVKVIPWDARNEAMQGAALLVNTTTQGMHGQSPLDVVLDHLPASAMVSDAVYIPQDTPLLVAARLRGHRTVNGLGMLLNQARPAFHAWFGVMPEVTPALRAAVQATF
jgi:shikimate dehydrogenase